MAPPRKKPLPPGTKTSPRKASISSTSGAHKHSSRPSGSGAASSKAAAAAAAALAAGQSSRSKPKPKGHRHVSEQSNLPSFERMDNGMRFTSFPIVHNINQKNYYTDYLKKDDQVYN
jgi:actin-related protein 8